MIVAGNRRCQSTLPNPRFSDDINALPASAETQFIQAAPVMLLRR
jgi:hypothetical protein